MKPYNKRHVPLAQRLRKEMTAEERKLWHLFLKSYPLRFRRQATIQNYIVDFYCPQAKLVIEIDGSQHYETQGMQSDEQRTKELEQLGLRIIRFSNRQINEEFDGVCQHIDHIIRHL